MDTVIPMTETAEKIKSELMQLSAADRANLAHLLILSLDNTVDEDAEAAWDAELERRLRRVEEGKSLGRPAFEALDEIREKYK